MNRHDRVLAIVLTAEHLLRLPGVNRSREIVETACEVVGDRLACLCPLDQDGKVVGSASQRLAEVAILFEPSSALQQLLGGRLILPEIRLRDAFFYCGKFFCGAGRVKDNSAGLTRGELNPGTCEADRRVVWA
jgi:hypothetical protein